MKKLLAMLLCLSMLLSAAVVMTSAAEVETMGDHWIQHATKTEEILAGKAGAEGGWDVPYLPIKPAIDGKISPNEYKRFRNFEEYISLMASQGTTDRGTTQEEFEDFCMYAENYAAKDGFVVPYWGWDGEYLYLAFEVQNMNGFYCNPEQDSHLFAHNCLQVGVAKPGSSGNNYNELGFGVNSETGDPITFTWLGRYASEEGDFAGKYDADDEIVTYECRIHLQKSLGLSDRTVQNGEQIKLGWLLSMNGAGNITDDGSVITGEEWQAAFCHGIGGPYSSKACQYFATVTFTGLPDGTEVPKVDLGDAGEEELLYGLREVIDLSKPEVADTFSGEYAQVSHVTEGEESFLRVQLQQDIVDYSYTHSSEYPRNVQAHLGSYVAIKYRLTGGKDGSIGLVYRNTVSPDYNFDDMLSDAMYADGEWHVALIDMTGHPSWVHFIMNMGIVPYADDLENAGGTLDISFIKVFEKDPFDLYMDMMGPAETEETESASDSATATEADSESASATSADTGAAETAAADEGCASVAGVGLIVALLPVAVLALRKKED